MMIQQQQHVTSLTHTPLLLLGATDPCVLFQGHAEEARGVHCDDAGDCVTPSPRDQVGRAALLLLCVGILLCCQPVHRVHLCRLHCPALRQGIGETAMG